MSFLCRSTRTGLPPGWGRSYFECQTPSFVPHTSGQSQAGLCTKPQRKNSSKHPSQKCLLSKTLMGWSENQAEAREQCFWGMWEIGVESLDGTWHGRESQSRHWTPSSPSQGRGWSGLRCWFRGCRGPGAWVGGHWTTPGCSLHPSWPQSTILPSKGVWDMLSPTGPAILWCPLQ